MENDSEDYKLSLIQDNNNLVSNFWSLVTKLCFNPQNINLECQTIYLLRKLLSNPSHHVSACDILRKTKLLVIVVQALASESRLYDMIVNEKSLENYMKVIELAAEANPYVCMQYLSFEKLSNYSGLHIFLSLLVKISLLNEELSVPRVCFTLFVRTISFLFSDARNCILLTRIKFSPIKILLESLNNISPNQNKVHLIVLRGILQILLHTSNFTKIWVEEFALYNGPSICLSIIVNSCSIKEDLNNSLNEECTILFDILCLLLSLPNSGKSPNPALYLYLRDSHWEIQESEINSSIYTSIIGLFGVRIIIQGALKAMKHRPRFFYYISRLLIRAIRISSLDIVSAGLVSESLVNILKEYIFVYIEKEENSDIGSVITSIIRLCGMVCNSLESYTKQKSGAVKICKLIVELASSSVSIMLKYTIQTLILLSSFYNEELFFTKLVSVHLFEELEKRLLLSSSNPDEIHLLLQIISEICFKIPSLQKKFLFISSTIVNLIRTEVKNGPSILLRCVNLLSFVLINLGDDASQIQFELKNLITNINFKSSESIISGCWGLQICIKAVKKSESARIFFTSEIENILICLENLCVNMEKSFSTNLINFNFCELFNEMLVYHRHQRDAKGTENLSHKYLIMCDFLLLIFHLLNILQANSQEIIIKKKLYYKLEKIITLGPFLKCRLYTSIISRSFIGMSSLSSLFIYEEINALNFESYIINPITIQDITCGWELYSSYGDDLFKFNKQLIIYPEYLQSLQRILLKESYTAEEALLGSSVIQLFIDIFSNCLENMYIFIEQKTISLISELFILATNENTLYKQWCFDRLLMLTKHLGKCGVEQKVMLYMLQMCLRDHSDNFVEYDNKLTKSLLNTWCYLLNESISSSQPMSFYGISAGFPTLTRYHNTNILNKIKKELSLYGGVDVPMQLSILKPENCVSLILWFLIEPNIFHLEEKNEVSLISIFFDQDKTSLILYLASDGKFKVRVAVKGNQQLRSKVVPVPIIKAIMHKWNMISISVIGGNKGPTSLRSKLRLEIQISLYSIVNNNNNNNNYRIGSHSTEVTIPIEMSLGVLDKMDHLFREVSMISLGSTFTSNINNNINSSNNTLQQLLFGSFGLFNGLLSKLELHALFAMGSDNLLSLSFMDKSFILSLYPTLANMFEENEIILTEEMLLLSAMWIQRGTYITGDQLGFTGLTFPFIKYSNKDRFPIIIGVCDNELCMINANTNDRRGGNINENIEKNESDISFFLTPTIERLNRIGSIVPISLKLSSDESEISFYLKNISTRVHGPRFHFISPLYSIIEAIGGISFFIYLTSLQPAYSEAFEKAFECVSVLIHSHSEKFILYSTPIDGGKYDGVMLLRTILHTRILISEKTAITLCKAIGEKMIIHTEFLPVILDFTLWSQDVKAFKVILMQLYQYIVDDTYGNFNIQILSNGIDSNYGMEDCYALEEFLLHLLMYFAGDTNGNWDILLIPFATNFIITLCRTTLNLRRILKAIICLIIGEETPSSNAIEWALGLLEVVYHCLEINNPEELRDEYLSSDIVTLLKCSNESIRCKVLSLLSWVIIPKEHLDAMVNEYLARKTLFPDILCLSEIELHIILSIIIRRTRLNDTIRARTLIFFLITIFIHIPYNFQIQILLFLNNLIKIKGSLIYDLVYPPKEVNHHLNSSIQSYLLALFPIFANEECTITEPLVELLTHISVYMIEISSQTENLNCGRILSDAILTIFLGVTTVEVIDQKRRFDLTVNKRKIFVNRFAAPCLRMFSQLLKKKNSTIRFINDYLLFLQTCTTVVILLDWCESESQVLNDENKRDKKEEDIWMGQTLVNTYFKYFKKQFSLGDQYNHMGIYLALLVFECSRNFLFELQTGDYLISPKKRLKKVSEELLLLQWKIAVSILYNAEKNDDNIVKEITLLHLSYSGNSEYGFNISNWEKQGNIIQLPKGSNWKNLQLSSNTLIIEILKKIKVEVLKDSAPWLIVLRAASGFLHTSMQENKFQFTMALSLCRLIRYNTNIWSLVKGGISSASISELESMLNIDDSIPSNTNTNTNTNITSIPDTLWGIELSRNGVAALEKYISSLRAHAFSLLQKFDYKSSPPLLLLLLSSDPRRALQHRGQVGAGLHHFQATLWRRATIYTKVTEEDGAALLAAHAAYRFTLLPWWGHAVSLYSQRATPMNRWELDHFLGMEWQRVRLRRYIHDVRITNTSNTDQLIKAVYKEDMGSTDDVKLLEFYSVTAIPQLLTHRTLGTDALTVKCKLILPMDRVPTILYIASQSISYVVEWFQHGLTQLGKESLGVTNNNSNENRPSTFVEVHDPINRLPKTFKYKHEIPCFRRVIDISTIRAIWPRRNLLQSCALELLFSNGETLFLAFDNEEIKKRVFDAINSIARPYLDKTLILNENNLRNWRNWWCEGRITNFHYLMYLNFAAGRSYGDLRQYPIFPHVISDFISDKLDLTSPNVFRRFDKPMGAQTLDREQRAIAKYKEIAALSNTEMNKSIDLVPHHYGSHYSPLGGALHYLVRVQPFSDYFVDMNSKLDDAGRVFDSMATAYTISTGKDVKELLPEFYCLPDLFINSNHIPFGTKQDGEIVNDVQLPPWASTPRELTQILRQALESRYTSENLHYWIDLIFGYKQRGKEAINAVNVFHPLTYEGSVDLLSITDPIIRSSHETQIDSFGQTPLQLFLNPHKSRIKSIDPPFFQNPCPTLRYEASNSKSCIILHPEQLIPINSYKVEGTIVIFPRSKSISSARGAEEGSEWKFPLTQVRPLALPKGYIPFTIINDQLKDCLCFRGNCIILVDGKDISREICFFYITNDKITNFTVDSPNVYVGMQSGAIHVIKISNKEWNEVELPLQNENGELIGISDTVKKIIHEDVKTTRIKGPVRRNICVLYGHTGPIVELSVSPEWGILVSSSEDYNVSVWDIGRYVLLRTIPYPEISVKYPKSLLTENIWRKKCGGDQIWYYDLIVINAKEGDIILAGHSLNNFYAIRLYTINGVFVASYDLGIEPATALLSIGGIIFIAQGMIIKVLKEKNLQWICDITHFGIEDSIDSLSLSPNGTILAACDRKGNLVTWKVAP